MIRILCFENVANNQERNRMWCKIAFGLVGVVTVYFGPWLPVGFRETWGFCKNHSRALPPPQSNNKKSKIAIIIPARFSETRAIVQATVDNIKQRALHTDSIHIYICHEDVEKLGKIHFDDGFASGFVIPTTKINGGRGSALNDGVRHICDHCNDDSTLLLLFCHADTKLPLHFDHILTQCLLGDETMLMCAFSFSLEETSSSTSLLNFISNAANFRSRFWWMPYGDQALAFRFKVFDEMGGFRDDFKMMEDFDLVRRVRTRALLSNGQGRICILPQCVETSARRWLERGVIKTTMWNWLFCAAYVYFGMSPDRIFNLYYNIYP